ncbi:hypothetical protein [Devosia sp. Naph2]|uniref:hypothetical protein n=1 Tax=Devosia polycyclovorans TaxID=3345148 RepID=UPI0035CEBF09
MTTPNAQSLEGLIERVKAATGPDRELDIAIGTTLGGWTYQPHVSHNFKWNDGKFDRPNGPPSYTASIDAALALVERCLPEWVVADLSQNSRHAGDPWGCELAFYHGRDPSQNRRGVSGYQYSSAALAIIAALLNALLTAMQEQNNER